MSEPRRKDLIYADLSYKIVGVLFEVFRQLGSGHLEKYYQRAVAEELRKQQLECEELIKVPLSYKDQSIGFYVLDFLIENKIVLEIKKDKNYSNKNIDQVYAYLKAKNLKLGILANFTKEGVKFKRILNIN